MKQLLLNYPEDEVRFLIKAAFEQCPQIKKYKERQYDITGNTGAGLVSWGVKIIVNFPESDKNESTPITIESKKNVSINITANTNRIEYEFMNQVEALRGYNIEEIREHKKQQEGRGGTKEIYTNFSENKRDLDYDNDDSIESTVPNSPLLTVLLSFLGVFVGVFLLIAILALLAG